MSSGKLDAFIADFEEKQGDKVESVGVFEESRASIVAKSETYIEVAETLRDDYGFVIPIAGGAIDYPEEEKMEMFYYLNSPESEFIVIYKIDVKRDKPVLPSLTKVWEAMSFHERETWEMFGIDFEGHDNLVTLLLPPGWDEGYPLRKDYKLEAEE